MNLFKRIFSPNEAPKADAGGKTDSQSTKVMAPRVFFTTTAAMDVTGYRDGGILKTGELNQIDKVVLGSMRNLPIIDRVFDFYRRIVGTPKLVDVPDSFNDKYQEWRETVIVNDLCEGILSFEEQHFDSLLLWGNAFGGMYIPEGGGQLQLKNFISDNFRVIFDNVAGKYRFQYKSSGMSWEWLDDRSMLVNCLIRSRNGVPWGNSILRHLQFVAQVYGRLLIALDSHFGRIASPPLVFTFEATDPEASGVDRIQETVTEFATEVQKMWGQRSVGKNFDPVQPVPPGYTLNVKTIGGDVVMDQKMQTETLEENIMSGLGVAPALIGFHTGNSHYNLSKVQQNLIMSTAGEFRKVIGANQIKMANMFAMSEKQSVVVKRLKWPDVDLISEEARAKSDSLRSNSLRLLIEALEMALNNELMDSDTAISFIQGSQAYINLVELDSAFAGEVAKQVSRVSSTKNNPAEAALSSAAELASKFDGSL